MYVEKNLVVEEKRRRNAWWEIAHRRVVDGVLCGQRDKIFCNQMKENAWQPAEIYS